MGLSSFNYNARRYLFNHVPKNKRTEPFLSFVYVVAAGLQLLINRFITWKFDKIDPLLVNPPHTVYLERYLNNYFSIAYSPATRDADIVAKKILWIEDLSTPDQTYLYNIAEAQPVLYLYNISEAQPPTYLHNINEAYRTLDFKLRVPPTLTWSPDGLKAEVEKFRQASKRYTIEIY